MTGLVRVAIALTGTVAMFAFWMVILVVIPMVVALYLARLLPLVGRSGRDRRSARTNSRIHQVTNCGWNLPWT